jgi:hypothetical protein
MIIPKNMDIVGMANAFQTKIIHIPGEPLHMEGRTVA